MYVGVLSRACLLLMLELLYCHLLLDSKMSEQCQDAGSKDTTLLP